MKFMLYFFCLFRSSHSFLARSYVIASKNTNRYYLKHATDRYSSLSAPSVVINTNFLVINCEKSIAWEPITFGQMFQNSFGQKDDNWVNCDISNGQKLPLDDIFIHKKYQGILITGSHHNARNKYGLPWMDHLIEFIIHAAKIGYPQIYGSCFGMQIITLALGGEIDYNINAKFVLQAENIQPILSDFDDYFGDERDILTDNTSSTPLIHHSADSCSNNGNININKAIYNIDAKSSSPSSSLQSYCILKSHADCVVRLPVNSIHLATSATCQYEMFLSGDGGSSNDDNSYSSKDRVSSSIASNSIENNSSSNNSNNSNSNSNNSTDNQNIKHYNILSCQSHPEFDLQYAVIDRIWPRIVTNKKLLNKQEIEFSKISFEKYKKNQRRDADELSRLISLFLRRTNNNSVQS